MAADPTLKAKIERLLGEHFSAPDRVLALDGYNSNIHVMVIAHRFDAMPEFMRLDTVWEILDSALPDHEKVKIALVLAFSPEEPEYLMALKARGVGA